MSLEHLQKQLDNLLRNTEKLTHRPDNREVNMIAKIKRDLQTKMMLAQIDDYEQRTTPKVIYKENIKTENTLTKEEVEIDAELDQLQKIKLNFENELNALHKTPSTLTQNKPDNSEARVKEHNDRINAVKQLLNNYDTEKKTKNAEYKTFEETCELDRNLGDDFVANEEGKAKFEKSIKKIDAKLSKIITDEVPTISQQDKTVEIPAKPITIDHDIAKKYRLSDFGNPPNTFGEDSDDEFVSI